MKRQLTEDGYGTPVGTVGRITGGFYAGEQGKLISVQQDDATSFSQVIEIMTGKDTGARMCYPVGGGPII